MRCVWDAKATHGEGPVWVGREGALYWIDLAQPAIHRYAPRADSRQSWAPPLRVSALAPRRGGGFVAAGEGQFALLDLRERSIIIDPLGAPEPERSGNRFNDGKVGPGGRFWAGTMNNDERQPTGALYRLDPNRTWQRLDDGYAVTNGPAFSPDGRTLYHTDSANRIIYAFDLDDTGEWLSNKRALAQFDEADGHPDGMCVDVEGCLWVAFWGGGCVRRLGPGGERRAEFALPVAQVSSCAFGGPRLDRLFVTTASKGLDAEAQAAQPLAGGLFEIDPGVTGAPLPTYAG